MKELGRVRLICISAATALVATALFASAASATVAGSISGTVTEFGTATAIGEVEVCTYPLAEEDAPFNPEWCTETASDGSYTVANLEPGEYKIEFWAPQLNYQVQFYEDKATWGEASVVNLTAGEHLTGKDGHLHKGATISGRITASQTGAPVRTIVCARLAPSGAFGEAPCVLSASDGTYTLPALPSGSYIVAFSEEPTPEYNDGFATQYYDRKAALSEATAVTVSAPEARTGIDALLLHPGEAFPVPPAPIVTPTVPKPHPLNCKKGFKKKKVGGKFRCVKLKKKKHKHHH